MASSIIKLGLALNNSALLGSGGAPPGTGALLKFKAALAASVAGTSRSIVTMVGDSTTAGYRALITQAPAALIGGLYKSDLGLPDMGMSICGFGIGSATMSEAGYQAYNPAVTGNFGASSGLSIGGNLFNISSNNVTFLTFAGTSYDTIEFYYPITSTASATVKLKLGATTIATVNELNATASLGKVIASGTAAAPLVESGASGTSFTAILWAYLAANKGCAVLNAGFGGSTTAAWLLAPSPWSPPGMLALVPSNLQVINLGINDWTTATLVTLANYTTNLQTMINNAKAINSDVFLVGPNRTQVSGGTPLATQNSYVAAMQALAVSNNVGFFDIGTLPNFDSWEDANAAGLMFDNFHPNATGYALIGPAIYAAIKAQTAAS